MTHSRKPGSATAGLGLVGAFALVTCGIFWPVLAGGAFYLRDILPYHRPIRFLIREIWAGGALPTWDPLRDGGRFLLANPNHRVLHPTALLDALLSVDAAFAAAVLLQVLLAGVGMVLLLRELGLSAAASRIGGAVYAFSGPMLSLACLPNLLGGAAWMPVATWCALLCWRRPRLLPLAALLCAVPLFAGNIETWGWCMAASIGLAVALPGATWPRLRHALLVVAGSLGIGAIQIQPALSALAASERGRGFPAEFLLRWSAHPLRALETLIPHPWGVPTEGSSWSGGPLFDSGLPLLLSVYLGTSVVFLAILGAASMLATRKIPRPRPEARAAGVLIALAAAALLLSLGRYTPLAGWMIELLPKSDLLRFPERLLPLAVPAVAMLAALGWQSAERAPASGRHHRLLLAAAAFVLLASWGGFGLLSAGAGPVDFKGSVATHALRFLLPASICLLLAAGAAVGAAREDRRTILGWLCGAAIAAELGIVLFVINPTVPADKLSEPVIDTQLLATLHEGEERGMPTRLIRANAAFSALEEELADDPARRVRGTFELAAPLEFGLGTALTRDVDRFDPLGCAYLRAFVKQTRGESRETFLDRAGANWIVGPPAPGMNVSAPTLRWRPSSLPLASLHPESRSTGPLQAQGAAQLLLKQLANPELDPRQVVLLSGARAPEILEPTWTPEQSRIEIIERRPHLPETRHPGTGPGNPRSPASHGSRLERARGRHRRTDLPRRSRLAGGSRAPQGITKSSSNTGSPACVWARSSRCSACCCCSSSRSAAVGQPLARPPATPSSADHGDRS